MWRVLSVGSVRSYSIASTSRCRATSVTGSGVGQTRRSDGCSAVVTSHACTVPPSIERSRSALMLGSGRRPRHPFRSLSLPATPSASASWLRASQCSPSSARWRGSSMSASRSSPRRPSAAAPPSACSPQRSASAVVGGLYAAGCSHPTNGVQLANAIIAGAAVLGAGVAPNLLVEFVMLARDRGLVRRPDGSIPAPRPARLPKLR